MCPIRHCVVALVHLLPTHQSSPVSLHPHSPLCSSVFFITCQKSDTPRSRAVSLSHVRPVMRFGFVFVPFNKNWRICHVLPTRSCEMEAGNGIMVQRLSHSCVVVKRLMRVRLAKFNQPFTNAGIDWCDLAVTGSMSPGAQSRIICLCSSWRLRPGPCCWFSANCN